METPTMRLFPIRLAGTTVATIAILVMACGDPDDGAAGSEPTTSLVAGFDQTLTLQGIAFHVMATDSSSMNRLTIAPTGLTGGDDRIEQEIDGRVSGVEVADLNGDGAPEIYIFVNSAGSGSYGSLVAFSADDKASLVPIHLPEITDIVEAAPGYMGHDRFAVDVGALVQRFPIYRDSDANNEPTGGSREVRFTLAPGESGWVLAVERVIDS
jgi:hypothetical protein